MFLATYLLFNKFTTRIPLPYQVSISGLGGDESYLHFTKLFVIIKLVKVVNNEW